MCSCNWNNENVQGICNVNFPNWGALKNQLVRQFSHTLYWNVAIPGTRIIETFKTVNGKYLHRKKDQIHSRSFIMSYWQSSLAVLVDFKAFFLPLLMSSQSIAFKVIMQRANRFQHSFHSIEFWTRLAQDSILGNLTRT